MDPGCAPQRVFFAHPLDEIAQLTIDLRPPCPMSRFPAPETATPFKPKPKPISGDQPGPGDPQPELMDSFCFNMSSDCIAAPA
jgi:hypothetical protein